MDTWDDLCTRLLHLLQDKTGQQGLFAIASFIIFGKIPNSQDGTDLLPCGASVVTLYLDALNSLAMDKVLALIDLADESLLLYPYKDVPRCWRRLLADAGLLRAMLLLRRWNGEITTARQLIHDLDIVMVVSGAPGLERREIANQVLDTVQDWLTTHRSKDDQQVVAETLTTKEKSAVEITLERPVQRLQECPSFFWFANHVCKATPVIIPHAIDHWPAMSSRPWQSARYLLDIAADRVVPVEIGRYTDAGWQQMMMRFEDFVRIHVQNPQTPPAYLAQHDLFRQIPRLEKDILVPDYCYVSPDYSEEEGEPPEEVIKNAWFGPRGTVSPLHHDPYHNLLAQVVGTKYLRLYSPGETDKLYPHEGLMSNTSQVDVGDPDLARFPSFATADYVECVLQPGELLYIPVSFISETIEETKNTIYCVNSRNGGIMSSLSIQASASVSGFSNKD
ncbi:Lysine-specific demethylase 8 [Apophysomyces ossiformis]|uniref:Lysine-specific demethylase 8 n=1 Tax=Apophysomyces ossiformis TaxID=679940 RepID=A0A8H7BMP0_9FUNG|nr:Lysine-specific demethylase 8 [Apophysomyces ossiformis]